MEFFMNIAQALVGNVGVDLCGGNRSVAKQGLHTADVRPVL